MAYFGNPYGYPQPQTPVAPAQNNTIIWVQGEAGAKSFSMGPNMRVALWDSEKQTIYLKSTDQFGMPSMEYIDYTVRGRETPETPIMPANDYISREEFDALRSDVESLKKSLGDLVN